MKMNRICRGREDEGQQLVIWNGGAGRANANMLAGRPSFLSSAPVLVHVLLQTSGPFLTAPLDQYQPVDSPAGPRDARTQNLTFVIPLRRPIRRGPPEEPDAGLLVNHAA